MNLKPFLIGLAIFCLVTWAIGRWRGHHYELDDRTCFGSGITEVCY